MKTKWKLMKKLIFSVCLVCPLASCLQGNPEFYGYVYFILPDTVNEVLMTAGFASRKKTLNSYSVKTTSEINDLKEKYGNTKFVTKINESDKVYMQRIMYPASAYSGIIVNDKIDIVIKLKFHDDSERKYNCRLIIGGKEEGFSEYTISSDGSNGIAEIPLFFYYEHISYI
jgi:hypothetical protein